MKIRKAKQILKTLADDTRLRVINLLKIRELSVTDMCEIMEKEQPNVSKHLARLRITGIVEDKRKGNNIFYKLAKPDGRAHRELINVIVKGLADIEIFKRDIEELEKRHNKKTGRR